MCQKCLQHRRIGSVKQTYANVDGGYRPVSGMHAFIAVADHPISNSNGKQSDAISPMGARPSGRDQTAATVPIVTVSGLACHADRVHPIARLCR